MMHYKNENPFNQVHINNILRLEKTCENTGCWRWNKYLVEIKVDYASG
jgi:hypothetical protein